MTPKRKKNFQNLCRYFLKEYGFTCSGQMWFKSALVKLTKCRHVWRKNRRIRPIFVSIWTISTKFPKHCLQFTCT